jgi:hypothetical protein
LRRGEVDGTVSTGHRWHPSQGARDAEENDVASSEVRWLLFSGWLATLAGLVLTEQWHVLPAALVAGVAALMITEHGPRFAARPAPPPDPGDDLIHDRT